jgi:glycosylphosphatidylinositol phospholipase D
MNSFARLAGTTLLTALPAIAVAATFPKQWEISYQDKLWYVIGSDTDGHYVNFGQSIAGVGDVDGDGLADILIGNPPGYAAPNVAPSPGQAFLVWGFSQPLPGGAQKFSIMPPYNLNLVVAINGDVTSSGGYTYTDDLGASVAGGVDMNHDGYPDIVVGAPNAPFVPPRNRTQTLDVPDGYWTGASYVLFGHPRPWPASVDASHGDGSTGFSVFGPPQYGAGAAEGQSVAMLRNFSGPAVVSGAPSAMAPADVAYYSGLVDLVLGRSSFAPFYMPSTDPDTGTLSIYTNPYNDYGSGQNSGDPEFGERVASAGDVNHDGYDDLIVGTGWNKAFVLFGGPHLPASPFDLGGLNGSNGFQITTQPGVAQVGSFGDVNGDGIDDFFVTSAAGSCPTVDVFFGRKSGFPAVLDASDATQDGRGFSFGHVGVVNSSGTFVCTPIVVSGVGDVNGDGIDDFAVSDGSSHVYLVFGHRGTWQSELTPADADSTLTMSPAVLLLPAGKFGISLARLGDVNGDGVDDFAIGASDDDDGSVADDTKTGGAVFVMYGRDGIFDNGFESQ